MSSSDSISSSNSVSIIKLDELSSFGATKQSRLPALIKLNEIDLNRPEVANSMPNFSAAQLEQTQANPSDKQQKSLPASLLAHQITMLDPASTAACKENISTLQQADDDRPVKSNDKQNDKEEDANSEADYQVVDMEQTDLIGPSLPQVAAEEAQHQLDKSIQALQSNQHFNQQHATHLGDSLIEMIINLRNENQNLVRALETNNEYVKERLSEFKRVQEESKKREAQFAMEKAEHEHQIRKLQRQNTVLSERLKSMEAKLKDMKLEVSESLNAAHSSKASSIRGQDNLYPQLSTEQESFSNSALNQATTMQVDATSGELYNEGDQDNGEGNQQQARDKQQQKPTAPPMSIGGAVDESQPAAAIRMANMTKEELMRHFDADKATFYAMDDPMKQCDKLEQQLNEIGKRDYEICLLQQQLNIYRQDFRLERMANLEAKIQIEKLKNDIDKLCLERLQQKHNETRAKEIGGEPSNHLHRYSQRGGRFDPAGAADALIGKLGHQLSKKAAKSAAKAAKYAAKQAHREERAAAAMARAAAHASASSGHQNPEHQQQQQQAAATEAEYHHRHHASHHRHHRPRGSGIRSEMVNDLLSTANKAMLTGYKMASTHVNLALDKLSQYEQQQANNLERSKQHGGNTSPSSHPSAPAMQPPSID